MFTGIIVATGRVTSLAEKGGDIWNWTVDAAALDLGRIVVGDSISVQGACLTVTRMEDTRFYADVSRETLAKTTLGGAAPGIEGELEPSLAAGGRAGRPLGERACRCSGQAHGAGSRCAFMADGVRIAGAAAALVAPKGSICINGVSLTVNKVEGRRFDVNIIPHTHQATTLGELKIDDGVNIEIDVIARYLDRLMQPFTDRRQNQENT